MSNLITLTLSRRNLHTLLAKLDRVQRGGVSLCTIIKRDQAGGIDGHVIKTDVMVKAAEDAVVYRDREPGAMIEDIDDIIEKMKGEG